MSPLSGPVLWPSAVLSAPAALMVFRGTMSLTDGLERGLIVTLICWAATSLVESFAFPSPGARRISEQESTGTLGAPPPESAE